MGGILMAFLDEKIAQLEQAKRILKKQEQEEALEKSKKQALDEEGKLQTLEELCQALASLKVTIEEQTYVVSERCYFKDQMPIPFIENFFDEVSETDNTTLFVKDKKGISLLCTYLEQGFDITEIGALKKQMEQNFAQMQRYVAWVKQEKLENLSYAVFRTPSSKGWIYNLIFLIVTEQGKIVGNFNCMEKQKDTYGLLLESIIYQIDTKLQNKERLS
jgi:hypothetical protein